jgi:hypothetical protein
MPSSYLAARELWRTLSAETYGHGALLRALPKQTDELAAFLDAQRLRLDEMLADTERLRSAVRTAAFAGVGLFGVFRMGAIKIADGLIGSQVFVVSEDDPPDVVVVLASPGEATEGHCRHLSESFSAKSH